MKNVMFAKTQESFAGALLDPERTVPRAVTSHTARVPQRRFAVYRNNVMVGLVEALRTQFPAVEKIVGDDFFAAMARVFVSAHPPRSPILVHYGDALADFIASFEPAAELPYLADVARLEAARTRAYHAADAVPLNPSYWQMLDPGALHSMRVRLHPSVQILRSSYPVVTIWAMNSGEAELRPIEDWRGEDAVIARPHSDVEVRALTAGGAIFLTALAAGASLADAAARAAEEKGFNLAANLAGLISAELAIELTHVPNEGSLP
jgi:hypothetical protein